VLVTQPAVRLVAARYSPATERVTRIVARVADLDGDGFSPLGGEGDCAPFDGSVHPFAVDVPGDGVDQDCHDGDLDPGVLPPRELAAAAVPTSKKRPNVVFVSVETLRADHTGFLGYARPTTPKLDAWADGGAVFERAYTVAPVTDRVMPAWLGGMYPSMYVEALDYQTHVMGAQRELLTERLQAAGYRTIVLQSYHLFEDHGLAQGVDDLTILRNPVTQDARSTTSQDAAKGPPAARGGAGSADLLVGALLRAAQPLHTAGDARAVGGGADGSVRRGDPLCGFAGRCAVRAAGRARGAGRRVRDASRRTTGRSSSSTGARCMHMRCTRSRCACRG
jgi:hypothetical protein